jgi:hypothetical protein
MAEENKIRKQIKIEFASDVELPVHFVNSVNVRFGAEEFYLTFGTAMPLEVKSVEDLEDIDAIEARPYFRCVVTRSVMRQAIDVMEAVYNQQSQQIDALHQSQEQERGDS